jgi:hypothetical protein
LDLSLCFYVSLTFQKEVKGEEGKTIPLTGYGSPQECETSNLPSRLTDVLRKIVHHWKVEAGVFRNNSIPALW